MIFYYDPIFIEKFLQESSFTIFAKIKTTQSENRLFGRHSETENVSWYFCLNMVPSV